MSRRQSSENAKNIYQTEFAIEAQAFARLEEHELDPESLWQAYRELAQQYSKLLNTAVKITRIGDRYHHKSLQANARLEETLAELRDTQQQLVEAEKMASMGTLVAGVAHEINTPVGICITAISTLIDQTERLADVYEKDGLSRDDLENYLESSYESSHLIFKNLKRTSELVQSFKRVSVDQVSEQQRRFAVDEYLQDVLWSLKPLLEAKNVQVRVNCPTNLEMNSFPGSFAQVITNLIENSLKHGYQNRSNGEIRIDVTDEDTSVHIDFFDDGDGIAPHIRPRMFDPFVTGNTQTGTGLGLHIIYNLVTQKLQGRISSTDDESGGVHFSLHLKKNLSHDG